MGVSRSGTLRRGHELPRRPGAAGDRIPGRLGFAVSNQRRKTGRIRPGPEERPVQRLQPPRRDGEELWWMSNRGGEPRRLDARDLRPRQHPARRAGGGAEQGRFSLPICSRSRGRIAVRRAQESKHRPSASTARAARPFFSRASTSGMPSALLPPTAPSRKPATTSSRTPNQNSKIRDRPRFCSCRGQLR